MVSFWNRTQGYMRPQSLSQITVNFRIGISFEQSVYVKQGGVIIFHCHKGLGSQHQRSRVLDIKLQHCTAFLRCQLVLLKFEVTCCTIAMKSDLVIQ